MPFARAAAYLNMVAPRRPHRVHRAVPLPLRAARRRVECPRRPPGRSGPRRPPGRRIAPAADRPPPQSAMSANAISSYVHRRRIAPAAAPLGGPAARTGQPLAARGGPASACRKGAWALPPAAPLPPSWPPPLPASACRKSAWALPGAACAAINAAGGSARAAPPGAARGSGSVHARPTPAPAAACAAGGRTFEITHGAGAAVRVISHGADSRAC